MPRTTNQPLPVLALNTPEQRFTCQSCGRCCRHFTVQLTDDDLAKIDAQEWDQEFGKVPYLEFRGKTWLRQREDGSCIFLMENGLCRIHAEHGYREKPLACQLFPFTLNPHGHERGLQTGLSFACPTVIDNTGEPLTDHRADLKTIASNLPKSHTEVKSRSIEIADKRTATKVEFDIITKRFDAWLARPDLSLEDRLIGAIALTNTLRDAVNHEYTEHDFEMVFDEAEAQTIEQLEEFEPDDPSLRELRLLRQSVYAHVEDPRIAEVKEKGIRRKAVSQLFVNRRFSSGKGEIPVKIGEGWPEPIEFSQANDAGPARAHEDRAPIEFLLMRYIRARILGGRAFGPGYYNFPITDGLDALWLSVAVAGWLARLHAAAHRRQAVTFEDAKAALLVTDRPVGRAPWFASAGEKMRLKYLAKNRGLDRLCFAFRMTDTAVQVED